MLLSPSALAPRIGDEVLPTPAGEWAEKTITSIKHSTVDFNLPPSRASTPGPRVPGAYPLEHESDYSRGATFHEGYVRTQKNLMNAVMGAGATAKRYLPGTWASYLSSSTEGKPIILKTIPQSERAKMQDADALHNSSPKIEVLNSGASSSSEAFPDQLSVEAQACSVPPRVENGQTDSSHLTSSTNPNAEYGSSLLSDISTKTINGSLSSSPSRYSSQLSLRTPKMRNGLSRSGSETVDTTYHDSDTGEPKCDRPSSKAGLDTVTPKHLNLENDHGVAPRQSSSEDSSIVQQRVRSNTPIEGPPAFLGPIESRSDGSTPKSSGTNTKGAVIGSSSSPKLEEARKLSDTKGAVEGLHGLSVPQPTVNTEARTHPLAGSDAKWHGVPLEEQYQKALDDNPDRQLNLGTGKDKVSAMKPARVESSTQEIKQEKHDLGTTANDGMGAPRSRTKSVIFAKPTENHDKTQRPVSEGYMPKGTAPSGVNTTPPLSGSSKASRASFIDKLKGEMKVISGKLSNNEAKVKEGRRLMGKIA